MTTELSTTSILSLFETTKEERQSFCIDIVSRLENGEADPLKVHLQIKSAEDLIKKLNENTIYKSLLLEAAQKYGKSFEFGNAKFETKEVGTKYDYSQCNDPKYTELARQSEKVTAELKAHETFLKTVPAAGLLITDPDTGETNTVYPPSKTSTTSVAVTLK